MQLYILAGNKSTCGFWHHNHEINVEICLKGCKIDKIEPSQRQEFQFSEKLI